ncbi:MAG: hypothetical protein WAT09_19105 [Paracoccaceae bacterium]
MNWTRMLIRAKRMADRPPSMRRVVIYAGVIAACLVIWAAERLFGWPAWLTVNSLRP